MKHLFTVCGLLLAIGLSGCAAFNYTEPNSPVAQATASSAEPKPRVALVLGSGAPGAMPTSV